MSLRAASRTAAMIALALASAGEAACAGGLQPTRDPDLEAIARCVADSGAIFYGAYWCPYCRAQKKAFGDDAGLLPYVECYDGPKERGMNERCRAEGIASFPTWKFPDGRVETGVQDPLALAAACGCAP